MEVGQIRLDSFTMRFLVLFLGIVITNVTSAAPDYHPSGSNLTWGAISNHQTIFGPINNPAAGAANIYTRSGHFGFGILSSIGFGYELGPIENFIGNLSKAQEDLGGLASGNVDLETIDAVLTFTNSFFADAASVGYAGMSIAGHLPMFPLIISNKRVLGGSIVLDASINVTPKLRVLYGPVAINPVVDPSANVNDLVSTRTSLYLKAAAITEFDIGYSRPIYRFNNDILTIGVKAKLYAAALNKSVIAIMQAGNIQQILEDQATTIAASPPVSYDYGIDVGALWITSRYRAGATFKNVRPPQLKYNEIGVNCNDPSKTTAVSEACYLAQSFGDQIDLSETYTLLPQLTVEGAVYSHSKNWLVASSLDIWEAKNPVSDPYQWFTLSAGYAPTNLLLPGLRAGIRQNLTGNQLTYGSVGFNWMILNFDVSASFKTIDYNGIPLPRSAFMNLGLDFVW